MTVLANCDHKFGNTDGQFRAESNYQGQGTGSCEKTAISATFYLSSLLRTKGSPQRRIFEEVLPFRE